MVIAAERAGARASVARRYVEKPPRCVRPSIMHVGGQNYGATPDEHGAPDIDIELREFGTDAGVKRYPGRCRLRHGGSPNGIVWLQHPRCGARRPASGGSNGKTSESRFDIATIVAGSLVPAGRPKISLGSRQKDLRRAKSIDTTRAPAG